MAQTQDQWLAKISKFVPSWYFEDKNLEVCFTEAVFTATAAMFAQIQADTDDAFDATFYTESVAPVLDLLGDERSIKRLASEVDRAYGTRIQNGLFIAVGENQLAASINACLNNGSCFMIENQQYGFYDDPDTSETPGFPYFDDYYTRWLQAQKWYNWWTVIIPLQTGGTQATIMSAIIAAIESNKAAGTTYDVLYEDSADTDPDD